MALPQLLIIEKEYISRELLDLTYTANFSCHITEANNYQEALDKLNSETFNLIVIGDAAKSAVDTVSFLQKIGDLGLSSQLIMVRDLVANYPADLAGQLHNEEGKSELLEQSIDMLSAQGFEIRTSDAYMPIPVEILLRLEEVVSPIYLKVSEKFVKYLNASALSSEDLERIKKKNLSEVYIRKNSFDEFLRNYRSQLVNKILFAEKNVPVEEKLELSLQAQELLVTAVKAFGINEKTAAIANRNIALAKDIVQSSDHLMSLLGWGIKKEDKNYSIVHSMLLCFVITSISQHCKYSIPFALEKMALGAFLHDLELSDHHIRNERQFIQGFNSRVSFNKEDTKIISEHPEKAANAVSKWAEAPSEVLFMIRHHHERPDGSGFPQGMISDEMPDYLVTFIVAHDIVDLFLTYRDVNMVQKEFTEIRKAYHSPNFSNIARIASELLSK
ncbi:MAG: HD-GYP domain-containing protein [Bdellovibrionia bacterium]